MCQGRIAKHTDIKPVHSAASFLLTVDKSDKAFVGHGSQQHGQAQQMFLPLMPQMTADLSSSFTVAMHNLAAPRRSIPWTPSDHHCHCQDRSTQLAVDIRTAFSAHSWLLLHHSLMRSAAFLQTQPESPRRPHVTSPQTATTRRNTKAQTAPPGSCQGPSPVPAIDGVVQEAVVTAGVVCQHKVHRLQLQQQLATHVPRGQVLPKHKTTTTSSSINWPHLLRNKSSRTGSQPMAGRSQH